MTQSSSTLPRKPDARDAASGATAKFLTLFADLSRQAADAQDISKFVRQAARRTAKELHVDYFSGLVHGGMRSESVVKVERTYGGIVGQVDLLLEDQGTMLGRAMASGETSVVCNRAHAEPFLDDPLLKLPIESAIVCPLISTDRCHGAIGLFHARAVQFTSQQLMVAEAVAHLLGSVAARGWAETALRRKEELVSALTNSMVSIMLVVLPDGTIVDSNRALAEISGFQAAQLKGRSLWSALLLPEELELVKKSFRKLDGGTGCERLETYLLTNRGERRRIAWSFSRSACDGQPALVGTGVDITDRCVAVDRAARAEAAADEAKRALGELKSRIRDGEANMNEAARKNHRLPRGIDLDRRSRARREYPYIQLIAPLPADRVPQEAEFRETRCHDISSRGFSFLSVSVPQYDEVVVAFGTRQSAVYLTADIRHATPTEIDGRQMYIVGCRYTGRIAAENSRNPQ